MSHDWDKSDHEVAAGAICPVPDCRELVFTCRPVNETEAIEDEPVEFTCPRCGFDFEVAENDLIFQSVPKEWLLTKVQVA